MDKDYLEHILEKIADHSASDEELRLYNEWCNAMQQQGSSPSLSELEEARRQTIIAIHRQISAPKRPLRWLKYSAAAAVAILIVGAGLFLYLKPRLATQLATQQKAMPANTKISPGKTAGTLTLADGRRIALSTVRSGLLTNQQGIVVSKSTDNQLVYMVAKGSAGKKNAVQYNMLSTANGEQYSIVLPDGTKAWLNAGSSLKFPTTFDGLARREVELSGEGYFEVVHNAKQPFTVRTATQYIEDIGTHFNVSSYADDAQTKTTLLEGSIKINGKVLSPGQQAASSLSGISISKVNTDAVVAWKNGYFEFQDENIYEIMKRIARWYNVEVVYEGKMPLSSMEGSMSRFANVSDILSVIQQTGLFTFRIVQTKIYVSSNINSH